MLRISETSDLFLFHSMVPSGPIPTVYDPDGVYPYESYCETSRRSVLRRLRILTLENDMVRARICPDLGGRVVSLTHLPSGKETLHQSPAVRPIRILPRQFFIGGGIEVSFPISHSPVQTVSVLYETARRDGRIYAWCGERELRFGMHWTVELSLGEGRRISHSGRWTAASVLRFRPVR
ncbi:MAG: DUF5107 domain-containing protein [Phycisphaerales bacterium]|jgi:hypothetical protein|nr:DUF5107 domain-containing protein [Phycisphaerales bacterium]